MYVDTTCILRNHNTSRLCEHHPNIQLYKNMTHGLLNSTVNCKNTHRDDGHKYVDKVGDDDSVGDLVGLDTCTLVDARGVEEHLEGHTWVRSMTRGKHQ